MTAVSRERAIKVRSQSPVVEGTSTSPLIRWRFQRLPLQHHSRSLRGQSCWTCSSSFPCLHPLRTMAPIRKTHQIMRPGDLDASASRQRSSGASRKAALTSSKSQFRRSRGAWSLREHSPQATSVSTPLSPVSTRRSSLVWFADKSTCGDDLSTDSNNGRVQCSGTQQPNAEWISEWRDDMATVLKQLQEIQKQEEDEDFRDLLANASVSSHGSSALSRSSASLGGQVVRWSGK